MINKEKQFSWAVIGAGPAGMAALAELLDSGVAADEIVWLDPYFEVGDFGRSWNEVSSNTSVKLFLEFLNGYHAFSFAGRPQPFELEQLDWDGYCPLGCVAEPLRWITQQLRRQVASAVTWVQAMHMEDGLWQLQTTTEAFKAYKVILATGCDAKTLLAFDHVQTIALADALCPSKLASLCQTDDTVAVFGSSHSSMMIIRTLCELGVKRIINLYLHPVRYAVKMQDWTLYDNTGLKAETAAWTRQNVIRHCLPQIERYLSTTENMQLYMPQCTKAVYSIGFKTRAPEVPRLDFKHYDVNTGIIAPGLFGCGIAFPRQTISPLGGVEMNVGLYKFMQDIRVVMPIWLAY